MLAGRQGLAADDEVDLLVLQVRGRILAHPADGLEGQLGVRCIVVKADAGDGGVADLDALLEQPVEVLVEPAQRAGRHGEQHRRVEVVSGRHGQALGVTAGAALAFLARPPDVLGAGGALVGLLVFGVGARGDAVVGGAIRGRGFFTLHEGLGVPDLGVELAIGGGTDVEDHHVDVGRRLHLAVDLAHDLLAVAVGLGHGPDLALVADDREAHRQGGGDGALAVGGTGEGGDGLGGGGIEVEGDDVAHGGLQWIS